MTPVVGRRKIDVSPQAYVRAKINRQDYKLADVQDPTARDYLVRYSNKLAKMIKDGVGLMISGEAGVGKSVAAVILAQEAMTWGFSVLKMAHADMQSAQSDFAIDANGETLKDRVMRADLLVLDGFNEDFIIDTRFGLVHAEQLIARRHEAKRSTILTTRLTSDNFNKTKELKAFLSVMLGNMIGIKMKGDDLRLKRNADLKKSLMEE